MSATNCDTRHDTATIHDAARRLGLSVRTVQRRIQNGDLSTIERDGKRLVVLDDSATNGATLTRQTTTNDATARDTGGELLAQLQAENEYLKAQVDAWRLQAEAANRTASETAAALRKALDAMPRELAAPAQSTLPTPRADAPQTPQSGAAAQPTGHTPNAPQRRPQREMRPLWKVILGIRS